MIAKEEGVDLSIVSRMTGEVRWEKRKSRAHLSEDDDPMTIVDDHAKIAAMEVEL
jgi:hypothetical protein